MSDELSTYYADLVEGSYSCVDRIVLNAYNPFSGDTPGGLDPALIKTLARGAAALPRPIQRVELIGAGQLTFTQNATGLTVNLPKKGPQPLRLRLHPPHLIGDRHPSRVPHSSQPHRDEWGICGVPQVLDSETWVRG